MPSRFRLRRVFKRPIYFVARPFARFGVRPDTITYTTLFLAFSAFFVLVVIQNQLIYGILVFMVGFFDGVDGAVARLSKSSRPAGAFIDSFVDKVSEILLLLSIMLAFPNSDILGISISIWTLLCIVGWILTSYSRSRAENLGVEDLDIGLGARSERLFILVIFSVIWQIFIGLFIVTIIGILTASYRFYHYTKELDHNTHSEPNIELQ